MMLILIFRNADGDVRVCAMTREQVLGRIQESYFGSNVNWLTEIPTETDPQYWKGEQVGLILDGRVCKVVPVEKIKTWGLE